jgi:hypothetical protein
MRTIPLHLAAVDPECLALEGTTERAGSMKIIFSGDFARPSAAAWRPTQHFNVRWLHDLFIGTLTRIVDAEIGYVAWNHSGVTKGGLNNEDVIDIYDACGLPRNMNGWAALYDLPYLPRHIHDKLAALFRDALVIGFEIPPYLKHFLLANGNPFIDFIVHPVRFHDDIFFGVQSSEDRLNQVLSHHAISEEDIYLVAGVARATAGRLSTIQMQPGTNLILMQTQHDKTQIRDGRFIGFSDFLAQAFDKKIFDAPVLLKPHPIEPNNPHLRIITSSVRSCGTTTANFYELLCCENLNQVVSLSSSTSAEAKYFLKDSQFLYKSPFDIFYSGDQFTPGFDSYFSLKDSYYGREFWSDLLDALNFPGLRPARISPSQLAVKPNRTRIALKSFWGYNQIDTDIAVRQYRPEP